MIFRYGATTVNCASARAACMNFPATATATCDKCPFPRVETLSRDTWRVTLDVAVEEYYQNEPVKKALVRYPLQVVRYAIDAEKNPWGLAIDCTDAAPQRLVAEEKP